jgi:hypothetical protein
MEHALEQFVPPGKHDDYRDVLLGRTGRASLRIWRAVDASAEDPG